MILLKFWQQNTFEEKLTTNAAYDLHMLTGAIAQESNPSSK